MMPDPYDDELEPMAFGCEVAAAIMMIMLLFAIGWAIMVLWRWMW